MYKTILIDLDDTIWDTRSNGKDSMEEVYRDYGFDRFFPDFDTYYAIYYPNNCQLWDKYRKGEITKDELIVERLYFPLKPYINYDKNFILSLNNDFLTRTTLRTKLLPYTLEVLEYLYPKYKLYILSNGFEEVQYKKINNSGLAPFFSGVILSDHVGVNKPHPQIFEAALKAANSSKEETIMLGDSWEADIIGAKNFNMDQIWYDLGIEQASGFEPTYHIRSLLELKEIL